MFRIRDALSGELVEVRRSEVLFVSEGNGGHAVVSFRSGPLGVRTLTMEGAPGEVAQMFGCPLKE